MKIFSIYPHLEELQGLSERHRAVFALSCTTRLVPNYSAFVIAEDLEQTNILNNAMELIERALIDPRKQLGDINEVIQTCEELLPDTERYTTIYTSLAFDAVSCVIYSLNCLMTGEFEYAVYIGQVALNTVDHYLYFINATKMGVHTHDKNLVSWIEGTPLFNAEIKAQKDTIARLRTSPSIDRALIEDLRVMTQDSGIRPFARGLLRSNVGKPTKLT